MNAKKVKWIMFLTGCIVAAWCSFEPVSQKSAIRIKVENNFTDDSGFTKAPSSPASDFDNYFIPVNGCPHIVIPVGKG